MRQNKPIIKKVERSADVYVIGTMFCAFLLYTISPYALILIGFGMLPAFIAGVIDQDKERYITHIVGSMNVAGMVPYLYKLLRYKGIDSAINVIVDPETWLVIFGAASLGWVVYWIVPQLALLFYGIIAKHSIVNLNAELDELAKEWGEEIKK